MTWPNAIAIVRRGTWLYDGSVVGEVRILKMKGERPNTTPGEGADEKLLHPPTDAEGIYFLAEFELSSLGSRNNGSSSWGHATLEGAVRYAEEVLPGPIRWDDQQ